MMRSLMFCPQCGSQQAEELRFCKTCGANLKAVRQAVTTGEAGDVFNWEKNWLGNLASDGERKLREKELESWRGIKPQVRRYQEIKGGVITGSLGIAITVFLNVFMQGIISSGKVTPGAAEILSHLWVAGVIPLSVGISLIINGLFVSKRLVEITRGLESRKIEGTDQESSLRAAATNDLARERPSVTEGTTMHLKGRE